jgi:hypothetical protein
MNWIGDLLRWEPCTMFARIGTVYSALPWFVDFLVGGVGS